MTQDFIYAVAASPNFAEDGICFSAQQSGLYRSEDGGQSWTFALESLDLQTELGALSVVTSPDFEHDRSVFAGVSGGMLRSIDGGINWEPIILPSPPPYISSLAVSPNFARDSVVLAGSLEDGVFRSADRARTWSIWNFGLLDLNTICMAISPDFAEDETLFIGTDSGIFRSTNGGRAWREADFSSDFAPVLSLDISPNYAEDSILFAGTEAHGLYKTSDRGQSWSRLAEDTVGSTINAIVLSPNFASDDSLLILTAEALLVSRDGGQSWSEWELPAAVKEAGLAAVCAPAGIDAGAPLLVGLFDGTVQRI